MPEAVCEKCGDLVINHWHCKCGLKMPDNAIEKTVNEDRSTLFKCKCGKTHLLS